MSDIDMFVSSLKEDLAAEDLSVFHDKSKFEFLAFGVYKSIKKKDENIDFVVKINSGSLKDAKDEYKIFDFIQDVFPIRYQDCGVTGLIIMPYLPDNLLDGDFNYGYNSQDYINICKSAQIEVSAVKKLFTKGYYNFDLKPDNIRIYNNQKVLIDFGASFKKGNYTFRYDTSNGYGVRFYSSLGKPNFENIEVLKIYSKYEKEIIYNMIQWDNLVHCVARLIFPGEITQKRYQNINLENGFTNLLPSDLNNWVNFFSKEFVLDLDKFKRDTNNQFQSYFAYLLMNIRISGMKYLVSGGCFHDVLYTLSSRLYFLEYLLQANGLSGFSGISYDFRSADICKSALRNLNDKYHNLQRYKILSLLRSGCSVSQVKNYIKDNDSRADSLKDEMQGYWGFSEFNNNNNNNNNYKSEVNICLLQDLMNNKDINYILSDLDNIIGIPSAQKLIIFMIIINYIKIRLNNGFCSHNAAIDRSLYDIKERIINLAACGNYGLSDNNPDSSNRWKYLTKKSSEISKKLYSSSSQLNSSYNKDQSSSCFYIWHVLGVIRHFFIRIYNWCSYSIEKFKINKNKNTQASFNAQSLFLARQQRRKTIGYIQQHKNVLFS